MRKLGTVRMPAVHYSLGWVDPKSRLTTTRKIVDDLHVGVTEPVPDSMFESLGIQPIALTYSQCLPRVFNIPDTDRGQFVAPNDRYFFECLSRLDNEPRTGRQFACDEYYKEVRTLIVTWMLLNARMERRLTQAYLVWKLSGD